MNQAVYITYAQRTPLGKIGGALKDVRPDDLLATLFTDFAQKQPFDLAEIDDIITGCANQAGEDNRNISRMAAVLAQIPYAVPAATLNRLCASSLDATIDGMARIKAGLCDAVLIGGVESMTRGPLVISKGSSPYGRDSKMYDTTFGWRFPNPRMEKMFPLYGMGETAEEVATSFNISRERQDQYALASHLKATKAMAMGLFQKEILPIEIKGRKDSILVTTDECPRADTSLALLAQLRPVFRENGSVTAGNSSPMNDGASCLFLASESFVKKHRLTPLAKLTAAGIRGVHPNTMGLGPIESTKILLSRYKMKIEQFDIVELNEAFAAQSLACIEGLQINPDIVNPRGGAIALGHPLGCSGARIVTSLVQQMQDNQNLKNGLATMCVGVGQGVSLALENCR